LIFHRVIQKNIKEVKWTFLKYGINCALILI